MRPVSGSLKTASLCFPLILVLLNFSSIVRFARHLAQNLNKTVEDEDHIFIKLPEDFRKCKE